MATRKPMVTSFPPGHQATRLPERLQRRADEIARQIEGVQLLVIDALDISRIRPTSALLRPSKSRSG